MYPQSGHGRLGVVVILVGAQKALEHPGDVTQVEEIVDLSWRGQEAVDDGVVHFNGGLCHDGTNWLHFLLEVLQFLVDHRTKDPLDLRLLFT